MNPFRPLKVGQAYAQASENVVLTITPPKASRRKVQEVRIPAGSFAPIRFRLRKDDKITVSNPSEREPNLRILCAVEEGMAQIYSSITDVL